MSSKTKKVSNPEQARELLGELARDADERTTVPLQEDRYTLARRLTQEIKQDYRNAIFKLRQVHAERLWQEMGYSGFEEYVLFEFGMTRKWGYQQLTRLRAAECLEAKGVTDPLHDLSSEAALVFRKWENRPDVFVLAFQQIIERGEQPTQERLDEECSLQADYLRETDAIGDLTFEEYRAYQRLQPLPYTYGSSEKICNTTAKVQAS